MFICSLTMANLLYKPCQINFKYHDKISKTWNVFRELNLPCVYGKLLHLPSVRRNNPQLCHVSITNSQNLTCAFRGKSYKFCHVPMKNSWIFHILKDHNKLFLYTSTHFFATQELAEWTLWIFYKFHMIFTKKSIFS